jgi:peptidoglycan hydrolase-like protein with peptidoglycan-binding domain
MKNEQVRLLQTRLRAEGFFSQESTGFFDEETRSAVCAFQEAHPSIFYRTGFVGPRTRAVLHGGEPEKEPYTLSRTLTHGARGDEVFLAQALLRVQGFFHFPYETGYFGELTQAGVRAFQKARGLAETGELDAETRVLLGK